MAKLAVKSPNYAPSSIAPWIVLCSLVSNTILGTHLIGKVVLDTQRARDKLTIAFLSIQFLASLDLFLPFSVGDVFGSGPRYLVRFVFVTSICDILIMIGGLGQTTNQNTSIIRKGAVAIVVIFLAATLNPIILASRPSSPPPIFSHTRGIYHQPFRLNLSTTNSTFAKTYYTLDGSDPLGVSGIEYDEPLSIEQTTVVRSAHCGLFSQSSGIVAHTYVFPTLVANQSTVGSIRAGLPAMWGAESADYEMDKRVTRSDIARLIQSLESLPTMAVSLDTESLFGPNGLYSNPGFRGDCWEKRCSVEYFDMKRGVDFQTVADLKIHGGISRDPKFSLKHSLRLRFPKTSTVTELPVCDSSRRVKWLVLKSGSSDSWNRHNGMLSNGRPIYVRDEFIRRCHASMGGASPTGMFVHLYLNNLYWGIYNVLERPDASFMSSRYGGKKKHWDVIKDGESQSGSTETWNDLIGLCRDIDRANTNEERNELYRQITNPRSKQALLDITDYIDYLIITIYSGNIDWPMTNYIAAIRRGASQGFRFLTWDSDRSFGNGRNAQATSIRTLDRAEDGVARPLRSLRKCDSFRLAFSDRIQHFFGNNGVFAAPPLDCENRNGRLVELFHGCRQEIDSAVFAESARWGDQQHKLPKKTESWRKECDELQSSFISTRSDFIVDEFRKAGLYRDAPTFDKAQTKDGVLLTLSNASPNAHVYYSLDGWDPRAANGKPSTDSKIYENSVLLPHGSTLAARGLELGEWTALQLIPPRALKARSATFPDPK